MIFRLDKKNTIYQTEILSNKETKTFTWEFPRTFLKKFLIMVIFEFRFFKQ